MSLHLPIAILAALSLAAGDCAVRKYDGPLIGISRSRSPHSSLNEVRQPDLSEVTANETVTNLETLNASIAYDLRIVRERVVNEDVTVALEYVENRVRDWSETVPSTLNPPDRGPMMLPM